MANGSQQPAGKRSSNFKQQRMKAWQPTPTACSTITTFTLIGIIFIILGTVLLVMSHSIVEVSQRYDNDDNCEVRTLNKPPTKDDPLNYKECIVTLDVTEKMEKPVFLYYKLNNFYQNHRRYVKSRDYQQLSGDSKSVSDLESNCEPVVKVSELEESQQYSWGEWIKAAEKLAANEDYEPEKLDGDAAANPCGLVAKSYMNDSYEAVDDTYKLDDSDIAWESDVDNKFGYLDDSETKSKAEQWTDPTNPHFIVWMRTAGLPNFRKLYAKIDHDIEADTKLQIKVTNRYDVDAFDGEKHLILSTTNAFGGRNDFLGIAYIVVGVISLIFAVFFGFKYSRSRKTS